MDVKEALARIAHGTEAIIPHGALEQKLQRGTPLIVKLGADPTSPGLHLGHAVVLAKMRTLQDLGHTIIFLIGDFTARIGDPTGRSKTRPPLAEEDIKKNTQTYFDQVTRILDPKKIAIRYNSEWLDPLTSRDWLRLAAQVTAARILERDDFAKRLEQDQPIGFHELFYPLLQGYDSVALKADIELGGTDQTFNMLMGRHLQEAAGQEGQVVITMPLLEGLDGVQKMSKSLGNAISLTDSPAEVFGKVMSISDPMMWKYYQLLIQISPEEIAQLKEEVHSGKSHPMTLKKQLAFRILERFWGNKEAEEGQRSFENSFEKKNFESAQSITLPFQPMNALDLVIHLDTTLSRSEARRLITSGALSINGERASDPLELHTLHTGDTIKLGKHRFYKVA